MEKLDGFYKAKEGETAEQYLERIKEKRDAFLSEEAERFEKLATTNQFEMRTVTGSNFSIVEIDGIEHKVPNAILKNEAYNIQLEIEAVERAGNYEW